MATAPQHCAASRKWAASPSRKNSVPPPSPTCLRAPLIQDALILSCHQKTSRRKLCTLRALKHRKPTFDHSLGRNLGPVACGAYLKSPRLRQSVGAATESTQYSCCLLYTSPSPRDRQKYRMPS